MDGSAIDRFARLVARDTSRRGVVRAMAGAT